MDVGRFCAAAQIPSPAPRLQPLSSWEVMLPPVPVHSGSRHQGSRASGGSRGVGVAELPHTQAQAAQLCLQPC